MLLPADRIIHTAAALSLLRIIISHKQIHFMFESVQNMTYRIRIAFGDSDVTYGGDDTGDLENELQGVLQGNTAGSDIWSALSSVIFDVLHKRGFAEKIVSGIYKQIFTLVGFAYVDDSDLIQSGTNPVEVLSSMQSLINSRGSLIEVTRGGGLFVQIRAGGI